MIYNNTQYLVVIRADIPITIPRFLGPLQGVSFVTCNQRANVNGMAFAIATNVPPLGPPLGITFAFCKVDAVFSFATNVPFPLVRTLRFATYVPFIALPPMFASDVPVYVWHEPCNAYAPGRNAVTDPTTDPTTDPSIQPKRSRYPFPFISCPSGDSTVSFPLCSSITFRTRETPVRRPASDAASRIISPLTRVLDGLPDHHGRLVRVQRHGPPTRVGRGFPDCH